jgi:hypothetical protein
LTVTTARIATQMIENAFFISLTPWSADQEIHWKTC